MPGPCFRLSILDCELLALTMSTQATPMFTLIDSASKPEISPLDRAGSLERQTHQECLPRRINPLEYALTEICACKSFRIRTYNLIGLKAPWNEHLQKRGPPLSNELAVPTTCGSHHIRRTQGFSLRIMRRPR